MTAPNTSEGSPADAPAALEQARESIDDLRITGMSFLRLRFPGTTPRKRNSIIESGGGSPGMTQLELHTNQGIIGRSSAGGSRLIEAAFARIKG